jgi:hypothetical protein
MQQEGEVCEVGWVVMEEQVLGGQILQTQDTVEAQRLMMMVNQA